MYTFKPLTYLSTSLSFVLVVLRCVALDLIACPTSYDRNRRHKYPPTSVAIEPLMLKCVAHWGHLVVQQFATALSLAVFLEQRTFYYRRLFLCIWRYWKLFLIITIRINHTRRSIVISFNYAFRATTFQILYPSIRDLRFRWNLFNSSRSIYRKRPSNQPKSSITKISKFSYEKAGGTFAQEFPFYPSSPLLFCCPGRESSCVSGWFFEFVWAVTTAAL
jgi:hypothetical protein